MCLFELHFLTKSWETKNELCLLGHYLAEIPCAGTTAGTTVACGPGARSKVTWASAETTTKTKIIGPDAHGP